MKILFPLLVAAALSGCAATGPAFTSAPAPSRDAEQVLVYIYRIDTFALGGRDAYFYVDGENVVDLSRNGYSWFHASAGQHLLKQKWPVDLWTFKTLETPVNWKAGQNYYYRFIASTEGGFYPTITFRWQLSEVSAEVAMREMKATKLQEALRTPK